MMQQTARSGEKAPLFGGRKPLFTQSQLLKLTWPLLVEQFLASQRLTPHLAIISITPLSIERLL